MFPAPSAHSTSTLLQITTAQIWQVPEPPGLPSHMIFFHLNCPSQMPLTWQLTHPSRFLQLSVSRLGRGGFPDAHLSRPPTCTVIPVSCLPLPGTSLQLGPLWILNAQVSDSQKVLSKYLRVKSLAGNEVGGRAKKKDFWGSILPPEGSLAFSHARLADCHHPRKEHVSAMKHTHVRVQAHVQKTQARETPNSQNNPEKEQS